MSDTKDSNTVEETKTNYPLLVEQLLLLAKEFNACDGVIDEIKSIKDARSFRSAYRDSFVSVANKFDIDIDLDDDDDDDDSEEKIEDLNDEIYHLEEKLSEIESELGVNSNLWDELKIKHFKDYKDNYTEWELEELLKNGKSLLNPISIH